MLKIKFLPALSFILLSLSLSGQPDKSVVKGIDAFEKGNYKLAYQSLNFALDSLVFLSSDEIASAYLYRGRSSLELLYDATLKGDSKEAAKYKNAFFDAYADFRNALKFDSGILKYEIKKEVDNLYEPLLQTGLAQLNAVYDGNYDPDDAKVALMYAGECLITANQIKENYVAYDLLGQVNLEMQDTLKAYNYFLKSKALFKADGSLTPDLLVGYVYYRLALIDLKKMKDPQRALGFLKEGTDAVNSEYEKIEAAALPPDKRTNYKELYNGVMQDLENLRRDIYIDYPEYAEAGVSEFKESLKKSPDDYATLIALASLLEKSDVDSAISVYKKAIEVEPSHEVAWFNLGVLYYNMGVRLNLTAKALSDPDSTVYFNKEAELKYENALPFLQKAFEINPNSVETIHALKQICLKTYRYEEYDLYDELEKKFRNK